MDTDLRQALDHAAQYQPVPWELIPDLGLYIEQVVTFITRMYAPLYGESDGSCLSASMINNYVKGKLIPRPVGKKYNREQIAMLCMIVALKQVASMEDIRAMLTPADGLSVREMYTRFVQRQQSVICSLRDSVGDGTLPPAMDFAIMASGYRVGFEAMLKLNPHQ